MGLGKGLRALVSLSDCPVAPSSVLTGGVSGRQNVLGDFVWLLRSRLAGSRARRPRGILTPTTTAKLGAGALRPDLTPWGREFDGCLSGGRGARNRRVPFSRGGYHQHLRLNWLWPSSLSFPFMLDVTRPPGSLRVTTEADLNGVAIFPGWRLLSAHT